MLRRRNLVIGVMLAFLAAAASVGHSWVIERAAAEGAELVPVVVAGKAITARAKLDRSMLLVRRVPRRWVVAGALNSLDSAAGRTTSVPLWAGEQVLAAHLAQSSDSAAEPGSLAPGERGAVVSVEPGTVKVVRPGDCVDVVAVSPSEDGLSQTSRLVSGLRVLRVSGRGEIDGGMGDPWVMLAVSPAQAQALALAEETGKVRLVLRSDADPPSYRGASVGAHVNTVASRSSLKSPGESHLGGPRPQVTVEVIRGVERETQVGTGVLWHR